MMTSWWCSLHWRAANNGKLWNEYSADGGQARHFSVTRDTSALAAALLNSTAAGQFLSLPRTKGFWRCRLMALTTLGWPNLRHCARPSEPYLVITSRRAVALGINTRIPMAVRLSPADDAESILAFVGDSPGEGAPERSARQAAPLRRRSNSSNCLMACPQCWPPTGPRTPPQAISS
jgi:hypothetical protein